MRTKKIVCLAKSRKGSGYCVAGREWDEATGVYGDWIRPLGAGHEGALSVRETTFSDRTWGILPLKFFEVDLTAKDTGIPFQVENWRFSGQWRFVNKKIDYGDLAALESPPAPLWLDPSQTWPENRRITADFACSQTDSLRLIKVPGISFRQRDNSWLGAFSYLGTEYELSLTDPKFIEIVESGTVYRNVFLVVSLAGPFAPDRQEIEYCYKLIACVFLPESTEN